eukprot:g8506.t2
MVLLVAGGVDFDTADAGAHGLSAVLRKPFTKTGFCNILRGMYLGRAPTTDRSEPTADAEAGPPPVYRPFQDSFRGQHLCPTKRLRGPEGAPLTAAAAAAAARCPVSDAAALGGSAVMQVGHPPAVAPSHSYPACLGFTPWPFTHPMIGAYSLGPSFLRPGQPQAGPQRKYTKIAPRELGGAVDLPAAPVEGSDRVVHVAADKSCAAVAADQAGEQAALPCSAEAEGLGVVVTGEETGESKIGPREGDDDAPRATPRIPLLLPASSVDDDVLSGEPAPARGSTEAAAAVLTPEEG